MTPNKEILKAFIALEANKDWQKVVAWLKEEHLRAAVDSTHRDGSQGSWVQGQAQALEMLLERINTAEIRLENIDKDQPIGMIL